MRNYLILLLISLMATSCQDQPSENASGVTTLNLPVDRYQYNNNQDPSNAISTLGRVLFYDVNLSANNTIACASCHQQSAGFADNQKFSLGFGGKMTIRNSMPIQNIQTFGNGSIGGDFTPTHLFW